MPYNTPEEAVEGFKKDFPCPKCNGSGSYSEYAHANDCNGDCPNSLCPVQAQVQCDCSTYFDRIHQVWSDAQSAKESQIRKYIRELHEEEHDVFKPGCGGENNCVIHPRNSPNNVLKLLVEKMKENE